MRSPSLPLLALLAAAPLIALAPDARANGRFPAAQVLIPAPGDSSFIVMRTTFGVVVSQDAGATWSWICEGAIGYDPNEDPSLGVTQSGTVLAGAFGGLFTTTDHGCTWASKVGAITDPVVDIVVSKSNAHAALVLTSSYLGQDDAGATFTSKVYGTTDDGAHWAQVGQNLDPEVLPETIEIAPSDPSRVYVSGTRKDAQGNVLGVILASTDAGATWAPTTFALTPKVEIAPFIAAVDPQDAKRLYVRIKGSTGTRVIVSTDAGATFKDIWMAQGALLGFALSSDGSKVYAGGTVDGMNVATRSAIDAVVDGGASPFVQQSKVQVQCLAVAGNDLLACSNEASGFVVGKSSDDGKTFAPMLHLCGISGPLACGASSAVTTACGPLWPAQQDALGGACSNDGGASSSSGGSSGASGSGGSSGSNASSGGGSGGGGGGCALTPASGGVASGLGALIAAGLALATRRRRRR